MLGKISSGIHFGGLLVCRFASLVICTNWQFGLRVFFASLVISQFGNFPLRQFARFVNLAIYQYGNLPVW